MFLFFYSLNLYSKNFLENDDLKDELLYWKYLLNEDLISADDFLQKKKDTLNSISKIKANNNVELKKLLISWNSFFKNLYNKNIITKSDYEVKLQESTKYIVLNFEIKTKDDLKEQLTFWKHAFDNSIVNESQYEKEKIKLLNIKLQNNLKIDPITAERINKLKSLYEKNLITKDEYEIKRRAILNNKKISNNLKDFACIKNYSNKISKKKVETKMCFCLSEKEAYYVIERTFSQKNYCKNNKLISYGDYLDLEGHYFHNEDSIGVGEMGEILTKEGIANWKNKMRIKKLEQELQNEKNKNSTLTRPTLTPRCKRGEVLRNNRCVRTEVTGWPWEPRRLCRVVVFEGKDGKPNERRVCN